MTDWMPTEKEIYEQNPRSIYVKYMLTSDLQTEQSPFPWRIFSSFSILLSTL